MAEIQPQRTLHTWVDVNLLREHPQNYRDHNDDQLVHIEASLKEHGFYRNVVVAEDDTILAGHGVVKASRRLGLLQVPVIKLPIACTSAAAMRVLVGDNEIGHRADVRDEQLAELLKSLADGDGVSALLGTGYDEATFSALLFVTRPPDKLMAGTDERAEWVGMPEWDPGTMYPKLVVTFRTLDDQTAYVKLLAAAGLPTPLTHKKQTLTMWYPPRARSEKVETLTQAMIEG